MQKYAFARPSPHQHEWDADRILKHVFLLWLHHRDVLAVASGLAIPEM
jgi:hypothetical protein